MLKELKLYPKYVSMSLRSTLSYKADSLIQMLSFVLVNIVSFATIYLMLNTVPSIGEWTFDRLAFLFGFILIPKAIDHILFDEIWIIAWKAIRTGSLDIYLTRPLNPLFQFIAKTFKWDGVGDLAVGIVLISIYAPLTGIVWTASNVIAFILCMILGIFIFTGLKLLIASLAFWFKRMGQLLTLMYGFHNYAKYPINHMGKALKAIMFYVIPFGLVLYYPIECLISGNNVWYAVLFSAIATSITVGLALTVWKFGLRRYDSSGS